MTGGTDRARRGQPGPRPAWPSATGWPSAWAASARWPSTPARAATFQVRDVAPHVLAARATSACSRPSRMGVDGVRRAGGRHRRGRRSRCTSTPAQELTQPEGDRDFRGGYAVVEALAHGLRRAPAGEGDRLRHLARGGAAAGRLRRAHPRRVAGSAAPLGAGRAAPRHRRRGRAGRPASPRWGIPTAAAVATRAAGSGPGCTARRLGRHPHRPGRCQGPGAGRGPRRAWRCRSSARSRRAAWQGAEQACEVVVAGLRQALVLTGSRDVRGAAAKPAGGHRRVEGLARGAVAQRSQGSVAGGEDACPTR